MCYQKVEVAILMHAPLGAQAAGGLLFRCEMCANAFCEDHLPGEAQVIVTCTRFQNFGQAQPKQVSPRVQL